MASLTIDLPDTVKDFVDQPARSRRFKDTSAFVQMLIAEAVRKQWREEVDKKLRESLAEYERGEGVLWKQGDCERMVREYLKRNPRQPMGIAGP
jgi:Arc/MetJ-type ribon-helix-helix transcriptional regulator